MGSQCLCVFMKLEAERRLEAFIEFVEAGEVLGGGGSECFHENKPEEFLRCFLCPDSPKLQLNDINEQ